MNKFKGRKSGIYPEHEKKDEEQIILPLWQWIANKKSPAAPTSTTLFTQVDTQYAHEPRGGGANPPHK